jgi:hypothetical protein
MLHRTRAKTHQNRSGSPNGFSALPVAEKPARVSQRRIGALAGLSCDSVSAQACMELDTGQGVESGLDRTTGRACGHAAGFNGPA